MPNFVPWNSQSLEEWSAKYAAGEIIDLDGNSTHYLEKGEGPPVILIHGYFLDSYTWANNIDALATRFKVYAVDLWGSGYSTREPLDYGYALYAYQIQKFMDALGIERASLVGHSMGGGTAIKFSGLHPGRVEKLILVDTAGWPHGLAFRSRIFSLPGVGEFLMGLKANWFIRMNLANLWFFKKESLSEDNFENLTRFLKIVGTTEWVMSVLRKRFFHTLSEEIERLGTLDIPTLIIWGREERSIPLQSGEKIHRTLTGSRLEILEQAGHASNFDTPDQFNQLAIDFLSRSQ